MNGFVNIVEYSQLLGKFSKLGFFDNFRELMDKKVKYKKMGM